MNLPDRSAAALRILALALDSPGLRGWTGHGAVPRVEFECRRQLHYRLLDSDTIATEAFDLLEARVLDEVE